jgi:hypothetical protein
MAQYGIPNSVDTVDVCESWNGTDYNYQASAVGSSDNVSGLIDSVQTTQYQNGQVTGYTPSGNEATSSMSTGGSSFDFVYADNGTRQASADYPYYGIGAPDEGSCLHPPCPVTSVLSSFDRVDASSVRPTQDNASTTAPFGKHGLKRHGVRALVDDAEEISRSPEGFRRFRFVNNGETHIRSIDPVSELLTAEESTGPKTHMVTKHEWKRVPEGYVRSRSQYELTEEIGGKKMVSHGTISFERIRVQDAKFPALRGSDVDK